MMPIFKQLKVQRELLVLECKLERHMLNAQLQQAKHSLGLIEPSALFSRLTQLPKLPTVAGITFIAALFFMPKRLLDRAQSGVKKAFLAWQLWRFFESKNS